MIFSKMYEPPKNSRCQKVPSRWFTNWSIVWNVATTVTWHPGFVHPWSMLLWLTFFPIHYLLIIPLFSVIQSEQMTALLNEIYLKLIKESTNSWTYSSDMENNNYMPSTGIEVFWLNYFIEWCWTLYCKILITKQKSLCQNVQVITELYAFPLP
jgi:hypothetical protein